MNAWLAAFMNSLAGLAHALKTERAVRQEALGFFLAIPAAILLGAGVWQRVALIASVLLLISIELLNTSLEKICDHVTLERHPQIKIVKDVASAAVLIALAIVVLVWSAAVFERLAA